MLVGQAACEASLATVAELQRQRDEAREATRAAMQQVGAAMGKATEAMTAREREWRAEMAAKDRDMRGDMLALEKRATVAEAQADAATRKAQAREEEVRIMRRRVSQGEVRRSPGAPCISQMAHAHIYS